MKKTLSIAIVSSLLIWGCGDKKNEDSVYENGAYMGEKGLYGVESFRRLWYVNHVRKRCLKENPDKNYSWCYREVNQKIRPREESDEFILNEWHKVYNPELAE